MRKYPIGLQEFREIREGGFLYVDKTRLIYELIESGKYYFLSRPRRFGKSLLLSTIKEIFSGDKELFKDLWIEDNWNWEKRHPVIHLRFSQMAYQQLGLEEAINQELDSLAGELEIKLVAKDIKTKFRELIRKAAVNGKVVILIDEYDKPIIDYLDDLPKAEENRTVFKSFYSVLKDADEYIRLLLITGVSRLSKVSIFSDLNNLEDISVGKKNNELVGITQTDLEKYFKEELAVIPDELDMNEEGLPEEIKKRYNGYSWGGNETVYNPFSLLSFMKQHEFKNFWFATGSPSFLIKQLRRTGEYNFENIRMGETALGSFNISDPLSAPLLFQTGYLTIKGYHKESRTYLLDYPNKEVEESLLDALLSSYRNVFPGDSLAVAGDLKIAMRNADIPGIIKELNAIISTIPYDHWKADSESIFHIIVHLTFKKIGVDVDSEVHSAKGRCDVIIKTADLIYAIELKLNGTAQEALDQIKERGYLQPYQADKRRKIALGISFSSEKREIAGYLVDE